MKTYAYGFPRIGKNREYKKAIEGFWKGSCGEDELKQSLAAIQEHTIATYKAHVDAFPVGEVTCYDSMLDTAVMAGLFSPASLAEYYELCRGGHALEMTKWFNTNYHYLVTDFSELANPGFTLNGNPLKTAATAYSDGTPYCIGPFTFLKLSKGIPAEAFGPKMTELAEVYMLELTELSEVHIDEPAFVLELTKEEIDLIIRVYDRMADSGCAINLFTYYDYVDWMDELVQLPVAALGLDFVRGTETMAWIEENGFPDDITLIAGLVDGRNVWRTDPHACADSLHTLSQHVASLAVSNAAPLMHVPITTAGQDLAEELVPRLAFAEEKLHELQLIADAYEGKEIEEWFAFSSYGTNPGVQQRVASLKDSDFMRVPAYTERAVIQRDALNLPLFPTTTIGSYPQTPDIRKTRAAYRNGMIPHEEYTAFIRRKMDELVTYQEELGLDVLVHGEFERTDMVEFFAQRLDGIATTTHGWITSYGTRAYRPAIIYGDVSRPKPMTVDEIAYAQSKTAKPVKGMLTGAVTIIAWDFVREDIPLHEVAWQIALALKDEIADLEAAGIRIIQVDEAAFKERAPIKKHQYAEYFAWATKSFRLTTAAVKPETQIHSHMCYSEFNDIIDKIHEMDFDVISIEASRSRGDVIEHFENSDFDRQIGLGVWDIHSPAVPSEAQMKTIVTRALQVIPKERFWINPDCGLKTRGWDETTAALKNMVSVARELRSGTTG
jgi:5-methyltetrahydropteroyltriglutamate--homocysteine methyltransferase